jgi:broad specificity phosphatase PhoE
MSTLYMIRHGQASFGQANYDCLSPRGEQQARVVADHFCRLQKRFDAVYTGTLARQEQTAQAMAAAYAENRQSLPAPQRVPAFDEYEAERLWRHLHAEILPRHPDLKDEPDRLRRDPRAFQKIFSRIVRHWMEDKNIPDAIEKWPDFQQRVTRGLKAIMQHTGPGKQVAVFTSAGPVAVAVQMATAISDERCADLSWQILNAAITRFRFDKDRFTLVGFNDVAALELAGRPELLTYR